MMNDNGILAYVPGELIGAAACGLGKPTDINATAIVDVHDPVRQLTARLSFRVRREPRWKRLYWSAWRADRIQPDGDPA